MGECVCVCMWYLAFVLLPNKNIFYCDSVNNWNLLFLFVCLIVYSRRTFYVFCAYTNIRRIKCEVKHSILTRFVSIYTAYVNGMGNKISIAACRRGFNQNIEEKRGKQEEKRNKWYKWC